MNEKCAPLSARGHDLYETPEVAVEALMRVEDIPQLVWEPACGPGAITRVLRRSGRNVVATDLIDYGCPCSKGDIDFLKTREPPDATECIITNPPYKLAGAFVEHALSLCPRVMMLLRLAFLESVRRIPILDTGKLARVHVFRNRLPMMHRDGWGGPKNSSAMPFAWYVWETSHAGPATIDRISWESPLPLFCVEAA